MNVKDVKQEVVALTQDLIRQESLSGKEENAIHMLAQYFKNNQVDDSVVDLFGSLIVTLKGNEPGPVILLDGHIDTVPVPDKTAWATDPFGGEVKDDRLYGRGASDMKGALAAMSVAACRFWKKTQGRFAGSIKVAGVVHEEIFEGVSARSISAFAKPDIVVIGEATGLDLNIGQRGRAEIKLESFGAPAHSANPEKGFNAVYALAELLGHVRALEPPHHPVLGPGILELTDIKSSPYPGASVIPDYCMATFDRRLLPAETPESVLQPIKALLDEVMEQDPRKRFVARYAFGSEPCYTGATIEAERFFPGWLFDQDESFIQKPFKELLKRGFDTHLSHYNFCTNGSHYAGEAGIPTIGMGPSVESLAHTIDEYIELSQLYKAVEAYDAIISAYLL